MNHLRQSGHKTNFLNANSELSTGVVANTRELTYEITGKCTLNCVHCSTKACKEREDFVGLDEFYQNMETFNEFGIVRLSGGEPFHHKDIIKIVDYLFQKGIIIEILSSGTVDKKPLSREVLEGIAGKVDRIVFSMHGYFENHHHIVNPEYEYGHPYWDDMMDSVEECADLGIPFSFQCVVMKENSLNIEENVKTVKLLNNLYADKINKGILPKIGIHFLRYIKQGRGLENDIESPDSDFIKNLPLELHILKQKYGVEISFSSNFEFKTCDCNTKKMVICADGSIIPCSALKGEKAIEGAKFACSPRL